MFSKVKCVVTATEEALQLRRVSGLTTGQMIRGTLAQIWEKGKREKMSNACFGIDKELAFQWRSF